MAYGPLSFILNQLLPISAPAALIKYSLIVLLVELHSSLN